MRRMDATGYAVAGFRRNTVPELTTNPLFSANLSYFRE